MSTLSENGKTYTIENGRVVAAVEDSQEEIVGTPFKFDDRVAYGKKLGSVITQVDTIYGLSIGVKFDDGSFGDYVASDLTLAPVAKEAGAVTAEGFEAEFNQYETMPMDTLEEVEAKMVVAKQLNLRAKANATNSKNTLADDILFDRAVTATGVDLLDMSDVKEHYRVVESTDYLEALPQFQVNLAESGFGMTGGGDMSWIGEAEYDAEEISDTELAGRASQTIANLSREQLEDKEFMRDVLNYSFENLPTEKEARVKFASLVNEARKQKLAEVEDLSKTASVEEKYVNEDGVEFDIDSIPFDAIFGV